MAINSLHSTDASCCVDRNRSLIFQYQSDLHTCRTSSVYRYRLYQSDLHTCRRAVCTGTVYTSPICTPVVRAVCTGTVSLYPVDLTVSPPRLLSLVSTDVIVTHRGCTSPKRLWHTNVRNPFEHHTRASVPVARSLSHPCTLHLHPLSHNIRLHSLATHDVGASPASPGPPASSHLRAKAARAHTMHPLTRRAPRPPGSGALTLP